MTVLSLHREALREQWLDAYGHMNEACYLLPLSNATWALQDHFGIGVAYFEATGCAIYTVESHLRYLREIRMPAMLDIQSMILGVAGRKLRFAHQMMVHDEVCATGEFMTLHFNTREGKTTPLPDGVIASLQKSIVEPVPDWAGRRIMLESK